MAKDSEYCRVCGTELFEGDDGHPGSIGCAEEREHNLELLSNPRGMWILGPRRTYRLSRLLLNKAIIFSKVVPLILERNPELHRVTLHDKHVRAIEGPHWEWTLEVYETNPKDDSHYWRELEGIEYAGMLRSMAEGYIHDKIDTRHKAYKEDMPESEIES